jgi:hypothetical protein
MRLGSSQAGTSHSSRQSLPLAHPAVNRGDEGSGFVYVKEFGRFCNQLDPEYVPAYSYVSEEPFKVRVEVAGEVFETVASFFLYAYENHESQCELGHAMAKRCTVSWFTARYACKALSDSIPSMSC